MEDLFRAYKSNDIKAGAEALRAAFGRLCDSESHVEGETYLMPLEHGKSKKVFVHNLKAEEEAGKPMKQSLAIAYAMKKRKKMSEGGEMESGYEPMPEAHEEHEHKGDMYDDLVDRIMDHREMMSEGGMVANGGDDDLDKLADGKPAEFDDLVLDDHLESHYGDDDNAGDALGNKQEDEDRADIISRIMRQRSMKQRNPRPA